MAQFDYKRDEAAREYLRLRIEVAKFLSSTLSATSKYSEPAHQFLLDLICPPIADKPSAKAESDA